MQTRTLHGMGMAGLGALALLLLALLLGAAPSLAAPAELGRVDWIRNFATGQQRARQEQKPPFLLFQEVPGCQTCVSFGGEVLSHPLLVEAIEDEFVPIAIYNNRGGDDRKVLERFGEPAWNNPVVRFVDAEGRELLPRRDGIWRAAEMAGRMLGALAAARRPVPAYLSKLHEELDPRAIARATLAMHCYWEGEACLGALPGLISSRTGSLGGREVVELRFDPTRIRYLELLRHARAGGCADAVFAHGEAQLTELEVLVGQQGVHAFAEIAVSEEHLVEAAGGDHLVDVIERHVSGQTDELEQSFIAQLD